MMRSVAVCRCACVECCEDSLNYKEQQPEHDPKSGHVVKEDPEGEPLVEEERAVSERDEKEEESKIDVSKGDDEEEEEEEIEVDEEEEDEPSPSPVKVRATRSSDAQKLLQVKVREQTVCK